MIKEWRALINNDRGDSKKLFDDLNNDDQLLYWYFHTYKEGVARTYIYFELIYNKKNKNIAVLGAIISTQVGASYTSITPIKINPVSVVSNSDIQLKIDMLDKGHLLQFECNIHQCLHVDSQSWQLRYISGKLKKGPAYKEYGAGDILEEWTDTLEEQEEFIDTPCSRCMGAGYWQSFAIPDEDYKRGLSGYALYSSNKVNANVACEDCGGTNTDYRDWFLDENPELKNKESKFVKGSGNTKVKRMSFTQKLDK